MSYFTTRDIPRPGRTRGSAVFKQGLSNLAGPRMLQLHVTDMALIDGGDFGRGQGGTIRNFNHPIAQVREFMFIARSSLAVPWTRAT